MAAWGDSAHERRQIDASGWRRLGSPRPARQARPRPAAGPRVREWRRARARNVPHGVAEHDDQWHTRTTSIATMTSTATSRPAGSVFWHHHPNVGSRESPVTLLSSSSDLARPRGPSSPVFPVSRRPPFAVRTTWSLRRRRQRRPTLVLRGSAAHHDTRRGDEQRMCAEIQWPFLQNNAFLFAQCLYRRRCARRSVVTSRVRKSP